MRTRSKVALACLTVMGLLILAAVVGFALLWSFLDLDDPIKGWLEDPTTSSATPTP